MRKSTKYKIGSGIVSAGVVTGITLVSTLLPNSEWVTPYQARLGTIIGGVLLFICILFAIWLWTRTFKVQREEIGEELEHIKTDLIILDKSERDIAIKKSQQQFPDDIPRLLYGSLDELFSISTLMSIIQEAFSGNIDPLLEFFQKMGDILDAGEYGLKVELRNNEHYQSALADLAQMRAKLHTTKRKKALIQTNIKRIRALTYGLNSSIIVRGILKSLSAKAESVNKSQWVDSVLQIVLVGLERIENQLANSLAEGLDSIDEEWKPKIGKVDTSELKVLFSLMSNPNNNV
jgi:hypothetical protein